MKRVFRGVLFAVVGAYCCTAFGASYSLAGEDIDHSKVYWGDHKEFTNAAEVRHEDLVRATPEFDELHKRRVVRDTARYWILLSQASERVRKAIAAVGEETEYDIVASEGYLQTLDAVIPVVDITDDVVANIEEAAETPQEGNARSRNAAAR